MSYVKQVWQNFKSGGTALMKDRLDYIEQGIADAHDLASTLSNAAANAANDYTDDAITALGPVSVYAQRRYDNVAGTWSARPSVPTGVRVTADSTLDVAAPPPPGAQRYDRWYPHPDSPFWP